MRAFEFHAPPPPPNPLSHTFRPYQQPLWHERRKMSDVLPDPRPCQARGVSPTRCLRSSFGVAAIQTSQGSRRAESSDSCLGVQWVRGVHLINERDMNIKSFLEAETLHWITRLQDLIRVLKIICRSMICFIYLGNLSLSPGI